MGIKEWSTPKKVLSGCLLLFILMIGGCGTFVFGIFSILKSSDAYTAGLEHAQENNEVKDLIGNPVEGGFWVSGSIQVSGPSGTANISFSVSGPDGSGMVYVVGSKDAGLWNFTTINFTADSSQQTIQLIPKGSD